jgi:putative ATP-dependent endonuclease of OLD family
VALRELLVEGFRGVRSARLSLDATTLLIGENDCGKSSLLEALALVLSPLGERLPRIEPWHFRREGRDAAPAGPLRIQVTLGESRAGSWDRPELAVLAPVLGRGTAGPRSLVVDLAAEPPPGNGPVAARWEIRSPGGRGSRDDPEALDAVRRMNPLVWIRGETVVGGDRPSADAAVTGSTPDARTLLESFERLVSGATLSRESDLESGYAAAERLLSRWAPNAGRRPPGARAVVAEILGRSLDAPASLPVPAPANEVRAGSTAQKLGTLLLTARVFRSMRDGGAPGTRPTLILEEPEAGLHPMTLASVWGLLERVAAQKIVTTNSGSLLSLAPLRSLRRLVRGADGVVDEWRVREGTLKKAELRKVAYHLRARRGAACFARCWLLVEGETEYWILPDLARLLGHDLAQEGVACVEFAQCGLVPLVKLARVLGIEWHVLADGDRAGEAYAGLARSLVRGEDESLRLSVLGDRDIEHCFWRHGHARVFQRLAGPGPDPHAPPRRLIEKAIDRRSKPGVAFELLASVAEPGSAGPPPPLRRAIETCVALARGRRTAGIA